MAKKNAEALPPMALPPEGVTFRASTGPFKGRTLTLQLVDPTTLVPDPTNPRKISDANRDALRKGLEGLGMVDPLIARRENRMLLGGHQRQSLSVEGGAEQVPVMFVHDLSDAEATALNLLLNNVSAQGAWDTDLLPGKLDAIEAGGLDVSFSGFGIEEAADIRSGDWQSDLSSKADWMKSTGEGIVTRLVIECAPEQKDEVLVALNEVVARFEGASVRG